MIIKVDKFFLRALQRNGYNLNYEKLMNIDREASLARKEALDRYNERLIKELGIKIDTE